MDIVYHKIADIIFYRTFIDAIKIYNHRIYSVFLHNLIHKLVSIKCEILYFYVRMIIDIKYVGCFNDISSYRCFKNNLRMKT